jgi:hypothetical protein
MSSKFGALKVVPLNCKISLQVSTKFGKNFGHFASTKFGVMKPRAILFSTGTILNLKQYIE